MGNIKFSKTLHRCDFVPADTLHSYEAIVGTSSSVGVKHAVVGKYKVSTQQIRLQLVLINKNATK